MLIYKIHKDLILTSLSLLLTSCSSTGAARIADISWVEMTLLPEGISTSFKVHWRPMLAKSPSSEGLGNRKEDYKEACDENDS